MDERCKQYHSALSRCAELLDNMKDGDPITEVPDFLAAYLASQSQAAQPSIKTWRERLPEGAGISFDYAHVSAMKAEIAELRAYLAGQSQATRAVPEDSKNALEMLGEADALLWIASSAMLKMGLRDKGGDCGLPHEVRMFALEFSNEGRDGPGALQVRGTGRYRAWLTAARKMLYAAPTTQEVTQQAAKAETAEQEEGVQANVLPPTRGTEGQHDAIVSTLPIEKIVQLMDENTDRHFGLKCEPFARAVEVETIRRFRAQGGNTNDKGSDLAPTTSTVSAPGGLVHVGNLSVYEDKEATFGHAYDISTNMDGHKLLQTLDGAELYALRTTSGKGEAA